MNLFLEARDYFRGFLDDWQMRNRDAGAELWTFDPGKQRATVTPRPRNLPSLLVAVGLAESNADASRLLKSKSIEWREWYGEGWWATVSLNDKIPEEYPFWIRRGKHLYGIKTVMLPRKGQTQAMWERLVFE